MTLESGTMLGSYRVESLLGRGGMGAVYLATDTRLDRRVALKVLAPELSEDERFRERFIAESRIAASLDHPNIVPVYEAGEIDGRLFIAMRYVDGRDLSALLAERGALPLPLAVRILAAVGAALDVAHAKGLVHRDVKPGNVLLTGSPDAPHAYLTDFGLTKRVGDQSMTRTGQIVGSIGYLAPEQVEGRPVDARTDVYSLGCLAFEVLTGSPPFPRDSDMATLLAHVQDPPPSLLGLRPDLPETLDAAVAQAMAKDPAARFPSAGEFSAAMSAAAQPDTGAITRGFLFADLRGYTAYVEAHGDTAASSLLDTYRRLMRDTIARHGGAEIKTEGDSFYVVFPSASSAVLCGLSIVAAASAQAASDPARPIRVGIGVNAGESVAAAEGYVGSAVNIAARVCATAKAGEVVVTETVRGLTRTSGRLQFVPLGKRHLKGIAEPIALFRAEPASGATVAAGGRGPIWRRPSVIAGAGGVLALGIVAAVVFSGGLGPGGPDASASLSSAPTELIAYTEVLSSDAKKPDCGKVADARLFLIDPAGTEALRLPHVGGDLHPTWSPDGTRLAFVAQSSEASTLYLMDVASREVSRLYSDAPPGIDPSAVIDGISWSADGTELVFTWGGQVWAVGSDSGKLRALAVSMPDSSSSAAGTPVWLADGSIAVILDDGAGGRRLAMAPAAGGELAPVPWLPATFVVAAAAWSADRSQVAVVGAASVSLANGGAPFRDLFLANADGSNQRTSGAHVALGVPAWSPDSSQIAFASAKLFVLDVASDKVRLLPTPDDLEACYPSWGSTTTAAIPQPTPTLAPGDTPAPMPFQVGPLDAGGYVSTVFQPTMQFQLPNGWEGFPDQPRNHLSGAEDADTLDVVTRHNTQGIFVYLPLVYVDGMCMDPKNYRPLGADFRELITHLQANPNLITSDLAPYPIGGITGLSIKISNARLPSLGECDYLPQTGNRGRVAVPIIRSFANDYWVDGDHAIWVISVPVHGTTVAFFVESEPADAVSFQAAARNILNTLTFP